jgi:hypothetical protein
MQNYYEGKTGFVDFAWRQVLVTHIGELSNEVRLAGGDRRI